MRTMSTVVTPELQATDTTASTYRAAVVCEFGGPLAVDQPPMWVLAARRVRVKVQASGVGIVTHKTQWFSGLLSGEQEQS